MDGFRVGTFGYLVPREHGKVARIDLVAFQSQGFLDLTLVDAELTGFCCGVTDGVYAYLAPGFYGSSWNYGNIVRFSLQSFDTSSVDRLQMILVEPSLRRFGAICADGTYAYTMPLWGAGWNKNYGRIARFDFATFSDVSVLDFGEPISGSGNKQNIYYLGCFTEGDYGYAVPNDSDHRRRRTASYVARFRLSTFDTATVEFLNLQPQLSSSQNAFRELEGGFSDGIYGYLTPQSWRTVIRFSLDTFDNEVGLLIDSNFQGKGGFTDGTYGYPVPKSYHLARFDLASFTCAETVDLRSIDPTLEGYSHGFTDDTYGYLVPSFKGSTSPNPQSITSKMVRFPLAVTTTSTSTSNTTTTTNTTTTSATTTRTSTTTSSNSTTTTSSTSTNTSTSTMGATSTIATAATTTTRAMEMTTTLAMSTSALVSPQLHTEEISSTYEGNRLEILCQMTMSVTNAPSFVNEPDVIDVLRAAVADLFNVSTSWVRNLTVTLNSPRILNTIDSQTVQYEDVDVRWYISAPPGTDRATVVILYERFERMAIQDATRIVNSRLSELKNAAGSSLKVIWMYARLKVEDDEVVAQDVERGSSSTTLLMVILVAVFSSTFMCLIVFRMWLKATSGKRVLLHTNSQDSLVSQAGSFCDWNPQSFLYPPKVVTLEQGDDIRRFAQSMQTSGASDVEVFLTYAIGHRPLDAEGMGPGMFFAMAIILALHEGGVPCFSELMLPWEADRTLFCDMLAKSSTSCKVMIVIQTKALYESRYALEEIFTAQRHNIRLLPVCFEEDIPPPGAEWPQVTRADVEGMIMVSQVQTAFCNLTPIPTPPATIPGDPKLLGVMLADVSMKIAQSHTKAELSSQSLSWEESIDSALAPSVFGESSMHASDSHTLEEITRERRGSDSLNLCVSQSPDDFTGIALKDKSDEERKSRSRAAKSLVSRRPNRRPSQEKLQNDFAKQSGETSIGLSSARLTRPQASMQTRPSRSPRPLVDSSGSPTIHPSATKDRSSKATTQRSTKLRTTLHSDSDVSPGRSKPHHQGRHTDRSSSRPTARTTRKTKPRASINNGSNEHILV